MPENGVTMVFTDLVNSTAVKQHLQGSNITARNRIYFDNILKPHRQRVEANLAAYDGRVVKTEGDAYFLVFTSAVKAVQWAVDLQMSHIEQPIPTPLGPLQVRLGMHAGCPLEDGSDFIGLEVDYAARVSALANGKQILLSEETAARVRQDRLNGFKLYSHGRSKLKGIGEVPIFELLYGGKQPQPPREAKFRTAKPRKLALIALAMSLGVTGAIAGVRFLGLLQPLELKAYDVLMRSRPDEGQDPRLLVVKVTAADVEAQSTAERNPERSLSDLTLDRLLTKLAQHQPRVIGLDIYRDLPVDPQYQSLLARFQNDDRFVTVCQVGSGDNPGKRPSPNIPPDLLQTKVGFADVVVDPDSIIRRHLLTQKPPDASTSFCQSPFSLSLLAALRYLYDRQINYQPATPNQPPQIGEVAFKPIQNHTAGYHRIDAGGTQILLNYRSSAEPFAQVTLSDVLSDRVSPDLIQDRIVLIGTTDPRFKDLHLTPYNPVIFEEIPGIFVQAHMVSQILSAVLDNRALIWWWPQWGEAVWIWVWAAMGGAIAAYFRSRAIAGLAGATLLCGLYGCCLILFIYGGWIPLIPAALAFGITWGIIRVIAESSV